MLFDRASEIVPQGQKKPTRSIGNGARILIVDDDIAICRMVARMLTAAGYICHSVNNAREAQNRLSVDAFELILCDITMPGESGLDLLANVKERNSEMAIIMLTGMDSPETAQLAFRLGADGYLLKPFEKNELLIQAAGALQRRALEIENNQYRDNLELQVSQRTAELSKANARLRENEIALVAQAQELKDMNTTLEVLLKKSDGVKSELQKNLSMNMQKVIHPYLRKIVDLGLTPQQIGYMTLIESALADMVSPMIKHFSIMNRPLTPAELAVAQLIKEGMRTKEIADLLNLSTNTILTHRYRIRKKLGLLGTKSSLHEALHTFQE